MEHLKIDFNTLTASSSGELRPPFVFLGRSDDDNDDDGTGWVSEKSYSSSDSSETILRNRSRISPVFAFFVFSFPFLKFAISFFLANGILRLLLQNCEPVKNPDK